MSAGLLPWKVEREARPAQRALLAPGGPAHGDRDTLDDREPEAAASSCGEAVLEDALTKLVRNPRPIIVKDEGQV